MISFNEYKGNDMSDNAPNLYLENKPILPTTSTVTFDTWVNEMRGKESDLGGIHYGTAQYLNDVVDGFMTSPAALWRDTPIDARSVKTTNIIQFREHLKSRKEVENCMFFVYLTLWQPLFPVFAEIDSETYKPRLLPTPVFHGGFWTIRYATLLPKEYAQYP